jgi:hypothetical protein
MNNEPSHRRAIGIAGTIARIGVGILFLSPIVFGKFQVLELIIGLFGIPLLLILIQRIRLSWKDTPLQATGLAGFIFNLMVFLTFYLTPYYYKPLDITSDVVLIFYGTSMLLAAARGYAGCEITAISNWILGRDDQVGCVIFSPIDAVEARLTKSE